MRRHRARASPPTARSRAAAAEAYDRDRRGVGRACSRADALEATWRLIRATNAYLEANEPWKAEPGPAVDAVLGDALEALRIVAVLASPGDPEREPGDLGAHRAAGLGADQRLPERGRVGRLPRRPAGRRRATPLFPRIDRAGIVVT